MSLNMDRHVTAHWDLYKHLVQGDGNSAEKHREFYDEYLAVMDLTAEFYLQTIDTVFVRHALPEGRMTYRGRTIDLSSIRHVALMTVEGEKDDISGVGQTEARTGCAEIPNSMAGALCATEGGPLWGLQRLSVYGRDRAPYPSVHS